ncbi:hypothetical protein KW786_02270 [Candidatus Parcubacteria bacterium]|nr:hypothetical protein [Candidatus Parcubacteria bacterium]
MVKFVVKSDGERVPFSQEKVELSIMAACTDAELEDDAKNAVVKGMSKLVMMDLETMDEEMSSAQLRELVLSKLDAAHPEVATAWREYEESKNV